MARKRYLITSKERYLNQEECELLLNLLRARKFTVKPHIISSSTYAIEIKEEEKMKVRNNIRVQINELNCAIYKTTDTIKALRERQQVREDIKEMDKAQAQEA